MQQAVEDLKGPILARYGDVYHQQLAWASQDIAGEEKLVADNPYTVTVTEGALAVVKTLMPVYDMVTLETLAFDAARALVVERGEPGPMASNGIRDIGAIPGKSR